MVFLRFIGETTAVIVEPQGLRLQLNGPVERLDGAAEPAHLEIGQPQIVMGAGVLGFETQRRLKVLVGKIQVLGGAVGDATVDVDREVIGLEADGL